MSDHALRVSKAPLMFTAIERVLTRCAMHLATDDLQQLQQYFLQQARTNLVNDTRAITCGDIFCAVIGSMRDGRTFVEQAIEKHCAMVFVEVEQEALHGQLIWQENSKGKQVPILSFYQLNNTLFTTASAFYDAPQQRLNMIGITGTNGKTSTSQIIANLLDSCGKDCAIIGTTGAGKISNLKTIENTTPGATELQSLLAAFVTQEFSDVAMEVSSHALSQKRVIAELFDTAVYTNLSRDHLDYHQTMAKYAEAKRQIFTGTNSQLAVINGDDEQAQQWLSTWPAAQPVIVFGTQESVSKHEMYVRAKQIRHFADGVHFNLESHQGSQPITSKLLGDFNVENLLAAIAVLLINKFELTVIANAVAKLQPIIGRMEAFSSEGKATAVVDYAHTPDALASALAACRSHCHGKLWVIFGCGGDRDTGKRALMAKAAELNADEIVITNDNPRTEKPMNIVKDIVAGLSEPSKAKIILDREEAILTTLNNASADDVVLCAGKGHEDYIIIGEQKFPYDERAIVRAFYPAEVIV